MRAFCRKVLEFDAKCFFATCMSSSYYSSIQVTVLEYTASKSSENVGEQVEKSEKHTKS